jgi:hypothetical protein
MSADRMHSQATGALKPSRRLALSTPMGVSAVAVVAVAIIASLLLFGPRGPLRPRARPVADPGYYDGTRRLEGARLQGSEVVGYGSVADTSDPHGDWTEAKWIGTAVER